MSGDYLRVEILGLRGDDTLEKHFFINDSVK